jgi:hypothetical protein
MIFDGKGKAEISGHAGYHSHVRIYEYMYLKNILTNILFEIHFDTHKHLDKYFI